MDACRATGILGVACLLAPSSLRSLGSRATRRKTAAAAELAAAEGAKPVPKAAFNVTNQVGVCAPFGRPGEYVWDPFGETEDMDEAKFRWYRQAEIKHGRVCMVALAGLLNQHYWRFQGLHLQEFEGGLGVAPNDFERIPNGFAAVNETAPYLGLLVILAGIIELRSSDDGREPGNFGDPLDISGMAGSAGNYDTEWRNFEINHGRLAMFGIVGALAAEYETGLDPFDQWRAVLGQF